MLTNLESHRQDRPTALVSQKYLDTLGGREQRAFEAKVVGGESDEVGVGSDGRTRRGNQC